MIQWFKWLCNDFDVKNKLKKRLQMIIDHNNNIKWHLQSKDKKWLICVCFYCVFIHYVEF